MSAAWAAEAAAKLSRPIGVAKPAVWIRGPRGQWFESWESKRMCVFGDSEIEKGDRLYCYEHRAAIGKPTDSDVVEALRAA